MKKIYYLIAMNVLGSSVLHAQSPELSNVSCNPGSNLNSVFDDYIQFNMAPVAPTPYYQDPYTYTVTATQNGNPVAVTLQSGTPATDVKYFADGYTEGFKLANGTAGNGDVIITVTPNWGSYPAFTVTLSDPGRCINSLCGTKTVTYTYQSDRQHTDFNNVMANIPQFNATGGKTLLQADVNVALDIFASNYLENGSTGPQPIYNYRLSVPYSDLSLAGTPIITAINEIVYETPGYPTPVSLPAGVFVPAIGMWEGDTLYSSGGSSTLSRIRDEWMTSAQFVGLDVTLDPRWVENAAGDASGALVADMFIVTPTTHSITSNTTIGTGDSELSQFIGTGNIPLTCNTLVSISSIGGGGNIIGSMVTAGSFTVTVTYTYTENCLSLSGNVYNDGNGNTNDIVEHTTGTGTGIGNPDAIPLYANLLDERGNVIAYAIVDPGTGAYSFDNIVGHTTYSVQISTNQGEEGIPAPVTGLPAGWVNTGEQLGNSAGVGMDAVTNGMLIVAVADVDVENVNFGIQQLPDSYDEAQHITAEPVLGVIFPLTNPLNGSDPEDTDGDQIVWDTKTIIITELPTNGFVLYYNGVEVTLGQEITNLDPSLFTISASSTTPDGTDETEFKYATVDAAGFQDPTPATYVVTFEIPLPVQLTSFVAESVNDICANRVIWTTAVEESFNRFELTSSRDGRTFETIATLPAKGNNSKYEYLDNKAEQGLTYYQLKMVDNSGKATTSNGKHAILACDGATNIVVYPTNTNGTINIAGLNTSSEISVTNTLGQVVINKVKTDAKYYELNIDHLPTANYFVVITMKGKNYTFKIVKN